MLAIAILCIVTIGLIYYQVFTQGMFGTLIMAVLCLVSAVVAMNYYLPLSAILNDLGLAKFGSKGISLMALFVLILLGLRELSDRLVRGNMNFPQYIDRVGSFFFATISSLTITGMIAMGIQNMPVSASIVGFDRCADLENPESDKRFFPCGDQLVTALMTQGSSHCFAGKKNFAQHHPDLLRELYINRIVPKEFEGSRKEAATDAVSVVLAEKIEKQLKDLQSGEPIDLKQGESLVRVKIDIKPGSDQRGDRGAKDVDGAIRFAMGHIRLVGYNPNDHTKQGYSCYPLGYYLKNSATYSVGKIDDGRHFPVGKKASVDLVFKWPVKLQEGAPQYIEFKRSARAVVKLKKKTE